MPVGNVSLAGRACYAARGGGVGNGERTRVASPPKGACRATDRSRSPVAWSKTLRVDEDVVCIRALPAGEPAEGRAFHAR